MIAKKYYKLSDSGIIIQRCSIDNFRKNVLTVNTVIYLSASDFCK